MSTDVLLRSLSRHLDQLRVLQARGLPPVACVLARLQGELPGGGYKPRYSPPCHHPAPAGMAVMTDAVFHPSFLPDQPCVVSSHMGRGGWFVNRFHGIPPATDVPEGVSGFLRRAARPPGLDGATGEAIQAARAFGERLVSVVRGLPAHVAERLGFDPSEGPTDWAEVLFHLGCHFPGHGIETGRCRILTGTGKASWDFRVHELDLQLGLATPSPDVFPGVIVCSLGRGCDFITATEYALKLILEAVKGIERGRQPGPAPEFAHLRAECLRLAAMFAHIPGKVQAQVMRLSDGFRTPPATEWAGLDPAGDGSGTPRYYVLSQRNASRVVCVVRGAGAEAFATLADRAGALLPEWPASPYPALLADVGGFARYCDPARFPWASYAAVDTWNRGMVTDHRGNVERWLGLVFGLLMAKRQEHLELKTRPEDATLGGGCGPVNAVLTLRGMDLFAASARAIDLGELLPPPLTPVLAGDAEADRRVPVGPPPVPAPLPTGLSRCLHDALTRLDEAAAGLARFGDAGRPFAEVTATWTEWRGRVAALSLTEAEVALRGLIDRSPGAPYRQLPAELQDLWLQLRCWGPGTTVSWGEFETSSHRETRATILNLLESWRKRLGLLFHYLGLDLPRPVPATEALPSPLVASGGAPDASAPEPLFHDGEWAVLTVLRDSRQRLMKNVDIEAAVKLSKRTVGGIIRGLITKGVVDRPQGVRRGAAITPHGTELVDRIRKLSAYCP